MQLNDPLQTLRPGPEEPKGQRLGRHLDQRLLQAVRMVAVGGSRVIDDRLSSGVLGHLEHGRPDLAVGRCLLALALFPGNMSAENRWHRAWLVVILDACAARSCGEDV